MKKVYNALLIAFVALFFCNVCASAQMIQNEPQFKMVTVPSMLSGQEERMEYLAVHFWNNFDFKSDTFLDHPKVLERAFANYVTVLSYAKAETANSSLSVLMNKAAVNKKMYVKFLDMSKQFLYAPESPLCNEEFLIPILENASKGTLLSNTEKISYNYTLGLIKKNRIGRAASDFTIVLENGQTTSLYQQRGKMTLLVFYNPGCHACKDNIDAIKRSSAIQNAFNKNDLKIVAVYPDQDLTEWKKYLNDIPKTWVNGYSKGAYVKENEVYDLKAIPMMYLLDQTKKVLLKDATIQKIDAYLQQNVK